MYYTPNKISEYFLDLIPSTVQHLLEPSVGEGNLISPIFQSGKIIVEKSICIDIDQRALNALVSKNPCLNKKSNKIIQADYLNWSKKSKNSFDLIVTNPPYSSKKNKLLKMNRQELNISGIKEIDFFVSIEEFFLVRCLKQLKDSGYLVAVLPSSIISSEKNVWIRQYLNQQGSILSVRELSNFFFKGVESKTYLLIFKKTKDFLDRTVLCNDFDQHEIKLTKKAKLLGERLDYGFHRSREYFNLLRHGSDLKWRKLSNFAYILRGSVPSPAKDVSIHTSDYYNGFWRNKSKNIKISAHINKDRNINKTDILVKRVGRNIGHSFGKPLKGIVGKACSDCVFIIRPNIPLNSIPLLFSLRTIMQDTNLHQVLIKGMGANYTTVESLQNLEIPVGLEHYFPGHFQLYCTALRERNSLQMDKIEREVCAFLKHKLTAVKLEKVLEVNFIPDGQRTKCT